MTLEPLCHHSYKSPLPSSLVPPHTHAAHPNFFNQLYAGVDQYGLGGSFLTDCLNTSIATYEIGPVFSLMELEMVRFCSAKIGWNSEQSDGVYAPGKLGVWLVGT